MSWCGRQMHLPESGSRAAGLRGDPALGSELSDGGLDSSVLSAVLLWFPQS